jgi:hypothetical protein
LSTASRAAPPDHPAVLSAITALHRAREAWPWVSEHLVPGPTDRRGTRRVSPAALARQGELLRTERAERLAADRAGIRQTGGSPASANLAAVDARAEAVDLVVDIAWLLADALHRQMPWVATSSGLVRGYGTGWINQGPGGRLDAEWAGATGYLLVAVRQPLQVGLLAELGRAAGTADRILRRAARVTPSREPVPGECPACLLALLHVEGSAPDQADWIVVCDNPACRCQGIECTCKLSGRAANHGQRHVWPARDFARLHTPTRLGWLLRHLDKKGS